MADARPCAAHCSAQGCLNPQPTGLLCPRITMNTAQHICRGQERHVTVSQEQKSLIVFDTEIYDCLFSGGRKCYPRCSSLVDNLKDRLERAVFFFCASFHPVDKWKTILVDCYTLIIPVNNAEKQIRLTIENKENRQHVTLSETQTFTVRSAFNQTVINSEGQPK